MVAPHLIYKKRVTKERNNIVRKAVKAVEDILREANRGKEETDYLTAMVVKRLMKKALLPFERTLAKTDDDMTLE